MYQGESEAWLQGYLTKKGPGLYTCIFNENAKCTNVAILLFFLYVKGPTEIRTRIAGFKVQSANHYTIGPVTATQFSS
jgi:hypothetical protein